MINRGMTKGKLKHDRQEKLGTSIRKKPQKGTSKRLEAKGGGTPKGKREGTDSGNHNGLVFPPKIS